MVELTSTMLLPRLNCKAFLVQKKKTFIMCFCFVFLFFVVVFFFNIYSYASRLGQCNMTI